MSIEVQNYLEDEGYEYLSHVETYHCRSKCSYPIGPSIDLYSGVVRMSYGTKASGLTRYTEFFTAKKNGKINFYKCDYYIQESTEEFFPEDLKVIIRNSGDLIKKIYVTRNNGYETDIVRFALFNGKKNIIGYNFFESKIKSFKDIKFIDWYDYGVVLSLSNGKLVTFELDIPKDNGYRYDGKNVELGNVYFNQKEIIYDKDEIISCEKIDTKIDDEWWDIKDSLNENIYLIKNKNNKYRILCITKDNKIITSDLYDNLELFKKYILPPLSMENQDPEAPYEYPDTGLVFSFKNSSESGEFIIDDKLNQYHRNCSKLVLKKSSKNEEN